MKKRQIKKYFKNQAKKGVLVCDGKIFYSNEKIIEKFKTMKSIETKSIDDSYPIMNLYGTEVFKISERGHALGLASLSIYS